MPIICARAEANPSAIVIRLRLIEREQRLDGEKIRAGRDCDLRNKGHALPEGTAGRGIVDVKFTVCGVVGIESHPEQALLSVRGQDRGEVHKSSPFHRQRLQIQNLN